MHVFSTLYGAKVLLVEDNKMNQLLVIKLLEINCIEYKVAHNGMEALGILSGEKFDAVLMDCQMPVMDGYEATIRIREQEKFKDLPIIALTAKATKEDREKAIASGMNDHIAKPFEPVLLFETLATWIKT